MDYKNKYSGQIIKSSDIVIEDDSGIMAFNSSTNTFQYYPFEALEMVINEKNNSYANVSTPKLIPRREITSLTGDSGIGDSIYGKEYSYLFGINKLNIVAYKPIPVSGFITEAISIKNADYIELSATLENDIMPAEFYIVEGNKEKPILPREFNSVQHEKLFYRLPLRFDPDESQEIIIYKNGIKTEYTYEDIKEDNISYDNDTYTISYTPKYINEVKKYTPEKEEIKIKIIQRCLNDILPGKIKAVNIIKYGGEKTWTI